MFLSELQNSAVFVGNTQRGVCLGIGISLKNQAVKYLLCASNTALSNATDFSVNVSAVETIDTHIILSRLRPVFPKNCAKLFIGLPVYAFDGAFLGNLQDVEIHGFSATRLFTDSACYPITAVCACADAVILRKDQPFPIGQRIPAPALFPFSSNASLVTKPLLKEAVKQGKLIAFTLSLPPFCYTLPEPKGKFPFFR